MTAHAAGSALTLAPGTAPARRLPPGGVLVAVVVGVGALALALTGQPLFALVPAVGVVAVALVLRLPLRWPLVAIAALAMLADVAPRHGDGAPVLWTPPTAVLQALLLDNLNKLVGVDALRVSGMELAIVLCLTIAAARAAAGARADRAGRVPSARPLAAALALAFVAVVGLELWGLARGGDARQSVWQIRQLLWLPPLAGLFLYAVRGARDFGLLLYAATATACVKVALGLYFYVAVAGPRGVHPHSTTSHSDSVLFVVVLALWAAVAVERPTARRLAAAALVWIWTLAGMVANNRRTAFVSLAAVLLLLFAVQPRRRKRLVITVGVWCLPLAAAYLAAATRRTTGIFAPAAGLMSAVTQKDASSSTRDIENFNLIQTLKPHLLIGTGWGHEYNEVVRAYDISEVFPQYRYIAHNSVLWLWSIGGLAGFTALWLHLGVGTFLAARAHRFAHTPDERAAAYGALAVITTYVIQAWADMGVMSWTTTGLLAGAYAVAAKLAVSTGAFPAPTRAHARGVT